MKLNVSSVYNTYDVCDEKKGKICIKFTSHLRSLRNTCILNEFVGEHTSHISFHFLFIVVSTRIPLCLLKLARKKKLTFLPYAVVEGVE